MKREVMEAKQNSSKGMFAVKLSEIICGSGIVNLHFSYLLVWPTRAVNSCPMYSYDFIVL